MIRKNVLFRALLLFRSRYFFSFVRIDFYVHASMLAELIRMNFTFISKKKEKKLKKLAIVFFCASHMILLNHYVYSRVYGLVDHAFFSFLFTSIDFTFERLPSYKSKTRRSTSCLLKEKYNSTFFCKIFGIKIKMARLSQIDHSNFKSVDE